MRFPEFEAIARQVWDTIPDRFKPGIDGLIIDQDAMPHDDDPDVFTLGECSTEEYPSQYGGPDTIRSAVVLYFGSFEEVSRDDADFDWRSEIRDTIMHELQHHLESLATEDALEDLDFAVDQNYRRVRGEAFDPMFYRAGEAIEAMGAMKAMSAMGAIEINNAFAVEGDIFLEASARSGKAETAEFGWEGKTYRVALPETEADVTYNYLEGGPDIGLRDFCIVRVLERGMIATLRSALGSGYTVDEVGVTAEVVS